MVSAASPRPREAGFGRSSLSVGEARQEILTSIATVGSVRVPLDEAAGRILAETVRSQVSSPPFAVSAMDGYAVAAGDLSAAQPVLPKSGEARAGSAPARHVPGTCMRIFTGAPVPEGADTVVIQEDTVDNGDTVAFRTSSGPGANIRRAGLNFEPGTVLADEGRMLTARDVGLLASAGIEEVVVARRPRIAILSTGDELREGAATADAIRDANRPALRALVRSWGGEPVDLGIAPDDDAAIERALSGLSADLLVITGGASVGDHDRVRHVLGKLGCSFDFWKIRMRPGKPLMFGRLGAIPVLGMPGNPVSAMVCSLLFLRPAMAKLAGRADEGAPVENARLLGAIGRTGERDDYLRAVATVVDGELSVEVFAQQDSSMLAVLAQANALVVRPAGSPAAEAGAIVSVLRFDHVPGY